jgi:hypothetical protein
MEVNGQLHVPAVSPGGKCPRYLLHVRLGRLQNQSGRRAGNKSCSYRDSISDLSGLQPIASSYTISGITTHKKTMLNNNYFGEIKWANFGLRSVSTRSQ